ncbi:MAG: aromatic amino acid lyase, partial [Cyclobacteriaceae bacterium]
MTDTARITDHKISARLLALADLEPLLTDSWRLQLSADAQTRIKKCRAYLDRKIRESSVPLYGINTGFGSLYNK